MSKIILLDKGHGGIIDNVYQTAPAKMFTFSSGEIAYEGVLNRQIGNKVIKGMKKKGFGYVDICPSELDIPLSERVRIINDYSKHYGVNNCLLISLHSNAGKGSGFEIWTSPGQTKSDEYAEIFYNMFSRRFPDVKMRHSVSDGDYDKEASFYILQKTACPAILPEFLFFDNWTDFQLLKSSAFQQRYADMIVDFVHKFNTMT